MTQMNVSPMISKPDFKTSDAILPHTIQSDSINLIIAIQCHRQISTGNRCLQEP
jgi:hypothetical protein